MMVRRIGRRVVGIAAIVLIAGIAAAAVATRNLRSGQTGGPLQAVSAPADVVARGKYLAAAADCAACHTAPGGAPYAGGLAMPSGFGTIYATNITPDPDDGIGRWSAEDFWRALHDGIRRDGQQLYPAMPYTSYRGMTRADADAIYAYVMQLLPMKVANRRTELHFPFNIRLGMLGWNVLFLYDSLPAVSAGNSPAWQRGRYLVNVLGHCGECHTPRGIAGEMELSRALTGFALSRVAAPDITPAGLASRGWTAAGLRAYLGRGLARQGSAFGDMHPVIMLSTRNLTAEDLDAVAIYLLGDNPPPPAPLPATAATESAAASEGGEDELRGAVRRLPRPRRQRHAEHGGGDAQQQHAAACRCTQPDRCDAGRHRGGEFPASREHAGDAGLFRQVSDAQAAALANYLRVTWGGQKADVTPAAVRALR
jgi:mono/diheme cytochrome c family protein